jgi:hypothetical protein
MPILKIARKVVYFAHVPKCAGTAIEAYLIQAFGPLAFHDSRFNSRPSTDRWTLSSPQHVDAATLSTLFPHDFFDASFAVVRSPVTRIVSAFRFQRDIECSVDPDAKFGEWLTQVYGDRQNTPWQFDNHTRPMDEIVPAEARVFRLEDGLDPLVEYLQCLAGAAYDLPKAIPPRNILDRRLVFEGKEIRAVTPTASDIALIHKYYAVDFKRFCYDPATGEPM